MVNKMLLIAATISLLMCSVEIHASKPSTINELFGQSNLLDQSNRCYPVLRYDPANESYNRDAEELIKQYTRLLSTNSPKCTQYIIYRERADVYSKLRQYSREIEDRKKVIGRPSSNLADYFSLGNAFLNAGRYEESVEHLTYVIDRMPKERQILRYRSLALYKLGKYELARIDALEYLSGFADVSDIIVLLGDIETGLKNYRKAKEHYEKALRVLKKDFLMMGFNPQKMVGSTDLALLYVKIAITMQRMNEKDPEQFYKLAVREDRYIYEPYYHYARFLVNKLQLNKQELKLTRELLVKAKRYTPVNDTVAREKVKVLMREFETKIQKR